MIIKTFVKNIKVIPSDLIPAIPKPTRLLARNIKEYVFSEKDLVLVEESNWASGGKKSDIRVKIYCGSEVTLAQIRRMMEYLIALSEEERKKIDIKQCDNLKLLFDLDKIITFYNQTYFQDDEPFQIIEDSF